MYGDKVESKSEALIAFSLHVAGVKFEYGKYLYAKDKSSFKPDFTIVHNGKEYYWEHLGKKGDKKYDRKWATKRQWYEDFFPGHLLTTDEATDIGAQIRDKLQNVFDCKMKIPISSFT